MGCGTESAKQKASYRLHPDKPPARPNISEINLTSLWRWQCRAHLRAIPTFPLISQLIIPWPIQRKYLSYIELSVKTTSELPWVFSSPKTNSSGSFEASRTLAQLHITQSNKRANKRGHISWAFPRINQDTVCPSASRHYIILYKSMITASRPKIIVSAYTCWCIDSSLSGNVT